MVVHIGNQEEVYSDIKNELKNGTRTVFLSGNSGTGKSFLMNRLSDEGLKIYFLRGDIHQNSREYYPFHSLISEQYELKKMRALRQTFGRSIKEVAKKLGSLSPIGGSAISQCVEEAIHFQSKRRSESNCVFTKEEQDIVYKIKYFCNKKNSFFVCDDIQYWDPASIRLLYTLLTEKIMKGFLEEAQFVMIAKEVDGNIPECVDGLKEIAQKEFRLCAVNSEEYGDVLKALGLRIHLKQDLILALFSITAGNLQLSKNIVGLLNSSPDAENEIDVLRVTPLEKCLVSRLEQEGELGRRISETLKYASLFGTSFQFFELQKALNERESTVRDTINCAYKRSFVNTSAAGAQFVHEIVRELFKKETEQDSTKYNVQFAECIKVLYPARYLTRATSLFQAEEWGTARNVLTLYVLRRIRLEHCYPSAISESAQLPKQLQEFLESMSYAYTCFSQEKYEECLEQLDQTEDILSPVFLAEREYLRSITLSKWLDNGLRNQAQSCLEPYLDKEKLDNETELWERIVSAYIVACVHNNDRETAKKYREKLESSIINRANYDIDAQIQLNILRRKCASIDPIHSSYYTLKKSKEFFSSEFGRNKGTPLNPQEFYMSLNNYIAVALKFGKYSEVVEDTEALLKLPSEFPYVEFPRFSMCINNAVIVNFLNSRKDAVASRQALESPVLAKEQDTISVVLKVNHAIFCSLSDDFATALSELTELDKELSEIHNIEFYYLFLVRANLAAVTYATGARLKATEIAQNLVSAAQKHNRVELTEHIQFLLKDIKENSDDDMGKWYREFPQSVKKKSYMLYYGRKYLFGELEFWSES